MEQKEKTYAVGDRVWYWKGQILVRCTVTYVDMQWRNKHSEGIIFYDLDEPVGHFNDADELHDTFESAAGGPDDWVETASDDDGPEIGLEESRRRSVRFILSTQLLTGEDYCNEEKITEQQVDEALKKWNYPPKQRGVDWFTVTDVLKRIGLERQQEREQEREGK